MLVFNTFPENVVKKQAVCVVFFFFFLKTFNVPRSLYTQKLLFNIKQMASWTTYGQSCHKMTQKQESS